MKKRYDDSKFINPETLKLYANTNEDYLVTPVKGVVIEFPGLGGGSCLGGTMDRMSYHWQHAQDFAKNGIILAYLFPGPWSWGNKGAIRMADAVVAAIAKKYDLGEKFPLVACGGSMGGMGCLLYSAGSSYELTAVAAACPGVDSIAAYDVLPDFPRTYFSAAAVYDMDIEEALKQISPKEKINEMPIIPYFICSDGEDECFPEEQINSYVESLRARGAQVEYIPQPNLKHGDFFPETRVKLHNFIKKQILG